MSDEEAPAVEEETPANEGTKPDEALGDQGKKALEAERTARAAAEKERTALAAQLKKLQDRDKTESEKTAERLDAAEKRAVEVEARATRAEIAATSSVPVDILAGPKSTSAEDVQAFADSVTAYVTEASKKNPNGPRLPNQGKQPEKVTTENADDWFRSLANK